MEKLEIVREFDLDFSGLSGIPSTWKIPANTVYRWLHQQARGHENIQVAKDFQRGTYTLTTSDPKSIAYLQNARLEVNWQGLCKRVPFKPKRTSKPRMWVRMYGSCKGAMSLLPNSYFDALLEDAGFVVITTTEKRRHFGLSLLNGQRSAQVERGSLHIKREQEWEDEEGNVFRWRLEYPGQPYDCRKCDARHSDGKCPKWVDRREEKERGGQQKCYLFSTSLFRLASDTKMTRVDAIPGAKIGHLANHVENDATILPQAEVVAIHAGANMDLGGDVAASKTQVEAQCSTLAATLKPLVDAKKHVFVVDPVTGPVVKEEPGGDHWAMVRSSMRKVAKKSKANWVPLHSMAWDPATDVTEDGLHWTTDGTRKVLKELGAAIMKVTGTDPFHGMEVQQQPYSAIYNGHYKFGCYRCTRMHDRGTCPPIEDGNSSNNINRSTDGEGGVDAAAATEEDAATYAAAAAATYAAAAAAIDAAAATTEEADEDEDEGDAEGDADEDADEDTDEDADDTGTFTDISSVGGFEERSAIASAPTAANRLSIGAGSGSVTSADFLKQDALTDALLEKFQPPRKNNGNANWQQSTLDFSEKIKEQRTRSSSANKRERDSPSGCSDAPESKRGGPGGRGRGPAQRSKAKGGKR